MKQKVILTPQEYDELKRLKKFVNDKSNLPGERRLAMAKFDSLYNQAVRRTNMMNNNNREVTMAR